MSKLIYIAVDAEIQLEIQEDHLRYLRAQFDFIFKSYTTKYHFALLKMDGKAILQQAERWYPKHPVTIQMRKDFDFEFNK